MRKNWDWLGALTGVLFVVVLILSFIVGGEPPDVDEPVQEIVSHYVDDKESIQVGAAMTVIAAALLVFFGAHLRRALRIAEGPNGVLSAVVLAGATIMAVGAAFDAMLSFAMAEAAGDIDPTAMQALQALWDNDFFPLVLGASLLLLSAGLSIIRHRALPVWLGWIAIVLGILGFTPIGFVVFIGGGLWILITSVMLALRARSLDAANHPEVGPPAAGGPPAAA